MNTTLIEPTEYSAMLLRVAITHDDLVVRDNITDTWVIRQDEIDEFIALTVAIKRGTLEEELFALPKVEPADIRWFSLHRPLVVLWVPGRSWL
jgi:hypothetical protein